jgi:hypothetical protein
LVFHRGCKTKKDSGGLSIVKAAVGAGAFSKVVYLAITEVIAMRFILSLFLLVTLPTAQNAISIGQVPKVSALKAVAFAGSDIGSQVNAAFTACKGKCKVQIPVGDYAYSTTINLPVATNGGVTLECDSLSTILHYTGSGDAIVAFGEGNSESGIVIRDCGFTGSGSTGAANGLHLRAVAQVVLENLRIINFPGDGVLNEGANTVTFNNPDIEGNSINIHNVGVSVGGVGHSANAVKVFGGIIGYAKKWGVFEDYSLASVAFPNGGNVYNGVVFEANGTNGQISGNAFLQGCDGCVIANSYLEFFSAQHVPFNVVVGDSSVDGIGGLDSSPQGVKVINNHLLSDNAVTSIFLINGRLPIVDGNSEVGNVTNFVFEGASVQYTYLGHNIALDATNFLAGPGVATNPPFILANIDGNGPTSNGFGFNAITGIQQDLQIRTRPGGTDNIVGENSVGMEVYSIDNKGVANFDGVRVEGAGLTFDTPYARINTVGGNNMVAGKIVVTDAISGSVTFAVPYNTAPSCQITPLEEVKAGSRWWVSTTASAVTANLSTPGVVSFSYFCAGDAN